VGGARIDGALASTRGGRELAVRRKVFFFEKRSKKLLLIAASTQFQGANSVMHASDKSFLVLFFKKDLLP
jgi:hypothetical protein